MPHKFLWMSAKETILERINYEEYFKRLHPEWRPGNNIQCPNSEAHDGGKDQNPSCKVFDVKGKGGVPGGGHCHTCGAKFSSVVGHQEMLLGGGKGSSNFHAALYLLWHEWIEPLVQPSTVQGFHDALMGDRKKIAWLDRQRGINKKTIRALMMGFNPDNNRITFPIPNNVGFWVNVRQWDWKHTHGGERKVIHWGRAGQFGANRIYPNWMLREGQELVWVEGEPDLACAVAQGYVAVTGGPAGAWKDSWGSDIAGKHVAVFGDVGDSTDAGMKGMMKTAEGMLPYAASVRTVVPPLDKEGGDFTDMVVDLGYDREEIDTLIEAADIMVGEKSAASVHAVTGAGTKSEPAMVLRRALEDNPNTLPLADASNAQHYMTKYGLQLHVAGRDLAPYLSPEVVEVTCGQDKGSKCTFCHMKKSGGTKVFQFHPDDPGVLGMVDCTVNQMKGQVKESCGIPKMCTIDLEVVRARNVEKLIVIPEISGRSDERGTYVLRTAYALKHGLQPNKAYTAKAYTAPDPRSMVATHVLVNVEPLENDLDTFEMNGSMSELEVFKPSAWTRDDVMEKLTDIANDLSQHVTMIYGRPDLHMAIDMVFHSVLQFRFNHEFVHKGWLDALVIGDTRCGKGYVAEGMVRHYRAAEVVSAENCSFAGLIGGMQQVQNRWNITWGRIPLNDRRMVVIDEVSGLSVDEIGRMSRVRSEGVAEITKIQSEKTTARTRLLWMGNPRSGEGMSTYPYGVEAVPELIGGMEDVARFDFATAVASAEVDPSIINRVRNDDTSEPKYGTAACRACITWVWSRKPDEVLFDEDTTLFILQHAVSELSGRYHPSIPLVQAENIRVKLARLAAAVAGRTFSSNEDGNLVVRKCHAEVAVDLMKMWYDKPSMGYHSYSDTAKEQSTLEQPSRVESMIMEQGDYAAILIRGLLGTRRIQISDVANWTGQDRYSAQDLIAEFVQQRAVYKEHSYYRLRPAMITLLRDLKASLIDEIRLD